MSRGSVGLGTSRPGRIPEYEIARPTARLHPKRAARTGGQITNGLAARISNTEASRQGRPASLFTEGAARGGPIRLKTKAHVAKCQGAIGPLVGIAGYGGLLARMTARAVRLQRPSKQGRPPHRWIAGKAPIGVRALNADDAVI